MESAKTTTAGAGGPGWTNHGDRLVSGKGDNVQTLIDHLQSEGYTINSDPNDWNNGSPKKGDIHIYDVYNLAKRYGYKDQNTYEGEVSIPLAEIDKLVAKRAVRAWTSTEPLGHWEDKATDVQQGETQMAQASVAIGVTWSNTKPNPVVIIGTIWTTAYLAGEWFGGWVESNNPDQEYVYEHRLPDMTEINYQYNYGGGDNKPFGPKSSVAVVSTIVALYVISEYKAWDDHIQRAKKDFNPPKKDTTNIKSPTKVWLGPSN